MPQIMLTDPNAPAAPHADAGDPWWRDDPRCPNFIIIGTAKAATTTIAAWLDQHPDAFVPAKKELMFFASDVQYHRGWEPYLEAFEAGRDVPVRGEGSILYACKTEWPHVVERMSHDLPDVKLILCVREPLARVESLWLQHMANDGAYMNPDFNAALQEHPHIFVDSSKYWMQIQAFREHYPDDRIHVMFYEDLRRDERATLAGVLEFLDLDTAHVDSILSAGPVNITAGKKIYTPTVHRLKQSWWYKNLVRPIVPFNLKAWTARQFFMKENTDRPTWDPAVRRWFVEQIRDDTRQFLRHYGKPEDFYSLDPDAFTS